MAHFFSVYRHFGRQSDDAWSYWYQYGYLRGLYGCDQCRLSSLLGGVWLAGGLPGCNPVADAAYFVRHPMAPAKQRQSRCGQCVVGDADCRSRTDRCLGSLVDE